MPKASLPLTLKITSIDPPQKPEHPVTVHYDVLDASGVVVLPRQSYTTAPVNIEEVARYTVERLSAQIMQASAVDMSPEVRAALEAAAGKQKPKSDNEQVLAPVGVTKGRSKP